MNKMYSTEVKQTRSEKITMMCDDACQLFDHSKERKISGFKANKLSLIISASNQTRK